MHVLKSFLKIVVLCSTFGHAAGRCIITPDTNGHVNIADGVTTIEDYAFYGCTSLKSVTIPDSVTSIGDNAFYGCSGLKSVTIPDGVTTIDSNAFAYCSGLKSVTIPDGVTTIRISAFYTCSGLKSVTIPDGVTSIESTAFAYCSGLKSVTIPDGVTSIESRAFEACSGLKSMTIPASVTALGQAVFSGTPLTCYISDDIVGVMTTQTDLPLCIPSPPSTPSPSTPPPSTPPPSTPPPSPPTPPKGPPMPPKGPPTPPPPSWRGWCFPAGAQLRIVDGSVARIEQVQLGDSIQTIRVSGASSYAAVHTITHADAAAEVLYCYATAAGRNITAECNNFIPAIHTSCVGSCDTYAETSLKLVAQLEVGDKIFEANSGTATASAVVVTAVGTEVLQGAYHLHANVETAALVVDGFVVSELVSLDTFFGHPNVDAAWTEASSALQERLITSIESRGDVRPPPTGWKASTYLTPRAQMGGLRLSQLMYSSLGATLKSQLDAKVLVSNWFLEHATEADVQTVSLLGEAFGFAKAADDPLKSHLTRQPPLAVETFTSAVGAISFLDAITFLFSAGDFFSNPQANFSLAQFMNRTGLLAVLSGDNVALEIIDKDVNGLSAGAIAGISVGSTVVAAAIVLGALRVRKRSKSALVRVQPKSNT